MLFCLGKAIRGGVIEDCKSLSRVSPSVIDLTQFVTHKKGANMQIEVICDHI